MGVRVPDQEPVTVHAPALAPFLPAAIAIALLALAGLLANGRPIGAGDTRANERVAVSLVEERDFDLDEHPEVEPPFAATVAGRRVSIYPVLSPLLAAPVFAALRPFFALDETGSALAGKLAASILSCLAAAVLYLCLSVRGKNHAAASALLLALGTSVWSTSQALWQHPAAVLFGALVMLCLALAEHDAAWAGRAGLPLALMVAARHADVALAAVLAVGIALRWPRRLPALALWALPAAAFVAAYQWAYFGAPLRHGFSGSLDRFSAPWGTGHLGLLLSPGKGLLVFTPLVALAAAGMVAAFRRRERWLVATLGGAAAAHWVLMGRWGEWHGGESWGPRLMTDALPLLFVFLPEGLDLAPRLGGVLAAVSVAVQALGAFAYDYQWERGAQRAGAEPSLWDPSRSPIAFYAQRRVLILAAPALEDGRAFVREHPVVLFDRTGARLHFAGGRLNPSGADPTFGDAHLQRGARLEGGRLRLQGRWAGIFLRVLPAARGRPLELRVTGRGSGILYVGERSFWTPGTRWSTYRMEGRVLVRHPYSYPQSGGADLLVTTGLGGGRAELDWVALVPPGEPIEAIRLE
jgi:hypothetical protein